MTDDSTSTKCDGPSAEEFDRLAKDRADWLLDAVACATQNRMFLRGDPEYDPVAGDAVLLNGEKAILTALREAAERRKAVCAKNARTEPDSGREAAIEAAVEAACVAHVEAEWQLWHWPGQQSREYVYPGGCRTTTMRLHPCDVEKIREKMRSFISGVLTAYEAHRGGGAVAWTRYDLAKGLAMLDGIALHEVKSTVGDPKDANNWREYLGRADDLLVHLSIATAEVKP